MRGKNVMIKWLRPREKRFLDWKNENHQHARWHVLDFNRHSFRRSDHVLHLEYHGTQTHILNCFPDEKTIELIAPRDAFYFTPNNWQEEIVSIIEKHFSSKINDFTKALKTTPPQTGDVTQETRGEEWLKTSLVVLERALAGLDNAQRLQASVFCGTKDGSEVLRFIVFNLDLSFVYHSEKKAMQVTCYNKKDQETFNYSKADFDGVFATRAYPVFDMAINLGRQISEAILREMLR